MRPRVYFFCLFLIAFLLTPLSAANHERAHGMRYEAGQNLCSPPGEGDWEIPRDMVVVCAGQDLVMSGHILLDVGAELHLVNGTGLLFASPGHHIIRSLHSDPLLGGGEGIFVVNEARVAAVEGATWSLHAGAETRTIVQDAELVGYEEIVVGPLYDPESGFHLTGSRLIDGGKVLVLASSDSASVVVTDNLIAGASDALTLRGGGALVENNTITSCNRAFVVTDNAAPQIRNNTVSTCIQSIMQDPSPVACSAGTVLRDNDFVATTTPAVGCMDAVGNYWGPLGPAVEGLAVGTWSPEPLHPERLPSVEVSWRGDETNHNIALDASQSRPSREHGLPIRFSWSFGDGATAEGATVEHTYFTRGDHQVRLLVQDELGLAYEWVETIRVGASEEEGTDLELQSVTDTNVGRASPGPGVGLLVLVGIAAFAARRR